MNASPITSMPQAQPTGPGQSLPVKVWVAESFAIAPRPDSIKSGIQSHRVVFPGQNPLELPSSCPLPLSYEERGWPKAG